MHEAYAGHLYGLTALIYHWAYLARPRTIASGLTGFNRHDLLANNGASGKAVTGFVCFHISVPRIITVDLRLFSLA